MLKGDGKHFGVASLLISPAALVRTFGTPELSEIFVQGTGQISFEDNNLDCYCIFDYKKTDHYHGLNRDDEFYETPRNLRKPLHKRKVKYPTVEEFWTSEEPKEFRLVADDQADWKKFRRWVRREIANREKLGGEIDAEVEAKYGAEVNICTGNWETKARMETDPACFKYDYTYHLSKDELKALKDKPETLSPPSMFDLSKAKRVFIDKDDIKRQEMEREQEKIRNV